MAINTTFVTYVTVLTGMEEILSVRIVPPCGLPSQKALRTCIFNSYSIFRVNHGTMLILALVHF